MSEFSTPSKAPNSKEQQTTLAIGGSGGSNNDGSDCFSDEKKESTPGMLDALKSAEEEVSVLENKVIGESSQNNDAENGQRVLLPATPSNASSIAEPDSIRQETPTVTPEATKKEKEESKQGGVDVTGRKDSSPPHETSSAFAFNSAEEGDASGLILKTAHSEVSDLDEMSPKSDEKQAADDLTDSSNDESSYFNDPNNLPSPKSCRRFSHSSIASAAGSSAGRRPAGSRDGYNRESDASLSLSEDSEDGMRMQQAPRVVPELFPHQITRMHSVGSLVSTSSHYSSDSDPDVHDELRDVASGYPPNQRGGTPTGRLSPILGQHPPSRVAPFFTSPIPQPSPPTILSAYQQQQMLEYPHPQPHDLTKWMSAGNALPPVYSMAPAMNGPIVDGREISLSKESASNLSRDSVLSYSEESGGSLPANSFTQASAGGAVGDKAAGGKVTGSKNNDASAKGRGLESSSSMREKSDPKRNSSEGKSDGRAEARMHRSQKGNGGGGDSNIVEGEGRRKELKVYWQRWIMLLYMSVLNLLSDWTCYSVAPIAVLTKEAFGRINAEQLVVVFLCANGISTACEPILLSRLGLRRTVVVGALLLMIGSIVKSGGMPPIIKPELQKGHGEWRVYLGFFLVGLSQPLYQCTPALLSASWFPERERTLATGVALNANQLGIGFAFIFGTLLVSTSDDIPGYFGLLSTISTLTFLGTLIQFEDAPPTPPSGTARVMRGTLPGMREIFQSVRSMGGSQRNVGEGGVTRTAAAAAPSEKNKSRRSETESASRETRNKSSRSSGKRPSHSRRSSRSSRKSQQGSAASSGRRESASGSGGTRRRTASRPQSAGSGGDKDESFHGFAPSPSPAHWGKVSQNYEALAEAPSPMMPGSVGPTNTPREGDPSREEGGPPPQQEDAARSQGQAAMDPLMSASHGPGGMGYPFQPAGLAPSDAPNPFEQADSQPRAAHGGENSPAYGMPYQGYPPPYQPQVYWDPRYQQYMYYPYPAHQPSYQQPPNQYYYSYQYPPPPGYAYMYDSPAGNFSSEPAVDVGAEPVLTVTPHHLDINIRDDQVLLSTRACLSRPGFINALVSFTVSGIVINTLSTFMDYLVRLNGAGREYTGIVGGSFQFVIMISSLIVGQLTDRTRAYYSVTVGMLVLGAFALAECGVNLDTDRGAELRWSLIIVAALVGPLQPVSTELGVEVVYPLSENTVLVIQQLFSNLLSALFIPCFKAFKDVGVRTVEESEQPEYTFSFYLLIVLHAAATVFFATFNGRYIRFEEEKRKKAEEEERERAQASAAFHGVVHQQDGGFYRTDDDQLPLIPAAPIDNYPIV